MTPFGWSLSITKTVVIPSAEDSLWHSYFCNEDVFIAVMDWVRQKRGGGIFCTCWDLMFFLQNENTKTDRHIGRSILTKWSRYYISLYTHVFELGLQTTILGAEPESESLQPLSFQILLKMVALSRRMMRCWGRMMMITRARLNGNNLKLCKLLLLNCIRCLPFTFMLWTAHRWLYTGHSSYRLEAVHSSFLAGGEWAMKFLGTTCIAT